MGISWGTTRFVVLVGPFAIKIARFRILRPLKRLITHSLDRQVKEKLGSFDRVPVLGAVKYLLQGIRSNVIEEELWHATHDSRLMPTLYSFLGIVNIQVRGSNVQQSELQTSHPFQHLLSSLPLSEVGDMSNPQNFCWHESSLKLVDYGSVQARSLFSRSQNKTVLAAT